MVGIVNYGIGNLASVQNAILKLGGKVRIESNPAELKNYDRLILPGVGAFGEAMENLEKSGMKESILEFAKNGKPLLGICLGMQLLFQKHYSRKSILLTDTSYAMRFSVSSSLIFFMYSRLWMRP